MNHAHQIDVGYHVPINSCIAVLIAVLVWCLWGLWIWLDARWRGEGRNPVLLLIGGPAAWVAAIWFLLKWRKHLDQMSQKETYKEWQRNQAEIKQLRARIENMMTNQAEGLRLRDDEINRLKILIMRAADAIEHLNANAIIKYSGLPIEFRDAAR